jgi:hypothetical protein
MRRRKALTKPAPAADISGLRRAIGIRFEDGLAQFSVQLGDLETAVAQIRGDVDALKRSKSRAKHNGGVEPDAVPLREAARLASG